MNVIISCDVANVLVHRVPTLHDLGHAAQVHALTHVLDQGQEHVQEPGLEPGLLDLAVPDQGHHGRGHELEQGQDHVPGPSLLAGVYQY
jgi:hypothetical protein